MAVQLPSTLQTHFGMVKNDGCPQKRTIPQETIKSNIQNRISSSSRLSGREHPIVKAMPDVTSFGNVLNYEAPKFLIEEVVKILKSPDTLENGGTSQHVDFKIRILSANIAACLAYVTQGDLKQYIRTRTRMDLEQAAAVVVSAFCTDGRLSDAVQLVSEIGTVLATSCMWIDTNEELSTSAVHSQRFPNLAIKLQKAAAWRGYDIPLATTYEELVPLLLRVRRCKPVNRGFNIPEWIFNEAGMKVPTHVKRFYATQVEAPVAPAGDDAIILSRHHFRVLQRSIFNIFQFWKREISLRTKIKKLEDRVLFAGSWIQECVFATEDVALLCHYFFHFQRLLQRKVVSNIDWTRFLQKGEGKQLYQNNTSIKSTFENVLLEIAESNDEGVLVAMSDDKTLQLIDETCLLMKEYVDVYGSGNTKNLVLKKGDIGGSGRGAVDEYNLLCDILSYLRRQARDEGIEKVPGPCRKFLAKDIMAWNDAFGDDAFAGETKAGWEDWLVKKGMVEDEDWGLVEQVEKNTYDIASLRLGA